MSGCGTRVEPVVTARRADTSVSFQRGCSIERLDRRRHEHGERGAVLAQRSKGRVGCETGMDGHRGAELQRRRGLDIEPADVEEGKHGEHVIFGGEGVHVLAHGGVPYQRLLAQHRPFRPAGRA